MSLLFTTMWGSYKYERHVWSWKTRFRWQREISYSHVNTRVI
jgi:hypothetical protein